MQKFTLTALFFLLIKIGFAQTNVTGTISSNTSWTLVNSPYVVTGNIIVSNGITLTIDSGVVVKFNSGRSLSVYGTLDAQYATLTSNLASPAAGDWGQIIIGLTSPNYYGKASFSYCNVKYGTSIYVNNGKGVLNETSITKFSGDGAGMNLGVTSDALKDSLLMTNCYLDTINAYGVRVNGGYALLNGISVTNSGAGLYSQATGKINVLNSQFKKLSGNGIYKAGDSLWVNNCIFDQIPSNGAYAVQVLAGYAYINGITATNCYGGLRTESTGKGDLRNSNFKGIAYVSVNHQADSILKVRNTTLENAVYGFVVSVMNASQVTVNTLWVDSVTTINCATGLHVQNYNSKVDISNSEFRTGTNGIYVTGGDSPKQPVTLTNTKIRLYNVPVFLNRPIQFNLSGCDFTENTRKIVYLEFYNLYKDITFRDFGIPYLFYYYGMTINNGVTMTVDPGCIMKLDAGGGITVNGKLVADGLSAKMISFTSMKDDNLGGDSNNDGSGSAPAQSNWPGITFENVSNDASSLSHCLIRYASNGIYTKNASPSVDSSTFTNNYFGARLESVSNPALSNNSFGSSQMTPIAMSLEANPVFLNNSFSFSDNQYDAIGLLGGTISANANLKIRSVTNIPNVTYLMLDQIVIPAGRTLTINKGIVIKATGQRILVDGTLIANGTADSLITFTSAKDDNIGNPFDTNKDGTQTVPTRNDFGGITFSPTSTGSVMNYCHIRYAHAYYYNNYYFNRYVTAGAVVCVKSSPVISNCEIKNAYIGIVSEFDAQPVISNCNMVNIENVPVAMSVSSDPVITNMTFTNVNYRAIGLTGGDININGNIHKRDLGGFTNITYVLLEQIVIKDNTTLLIEPGVVIKSGNYYSSIEVQGTLKVNGKANDKVIFSSVNDDNHGNPFDTNGDGNSTQPARGNWSRILFQPGSNDTASFIRNAEFWYGGGYTSEGTLTFDSADPTIDSVLINQSSSYGLLFRGVAKTKVNHVVIQNCASDPIALTLFSDPAFGSDITFTANRSKGLRLLDTDLGSEATIRKRDLAGITNIAYLVDGLRVNGSGILNIQPGVVIKSESYGIAVVGGIMRAIGTASSKIIFTSFKDDSHGGDTNNDGNSSVPAPGNWNGIAFANTGNANILKNVIISYAGGHGGWMPYPYYVAPGVGVINVNNGDVIVDSVTIQLCNYAAFGIFGTANPHIQSCEILNVVYDAPVYMSMFSNPTFGNINVQNVKYLGLRIIPETWSQSATIPQRNFAGISNITYIFDGGFTINSGTTITIPAGTVFKRTYYGYFTVNGKLMVEGSNLNKVIFTDVSDDAVGNPKDLNQDGNASAPTKGTGYTWWMYFSDVSDDASVIKHADFRYAPYGIIMGSASPTIINNRFYKTAAGVGLDGVSHPVLDSNAFVDLANYPFYVSLVSYPSSTKGNTLTGTTWKGIGIQSETLVQDVTLPKRSFAGIANIPYFFTGPYTIGTGATLTIEPGVVCKFSNGGYISVQKGLIAKGGSTPDSNIVFTHFKDDFYGGDFNSDSNATAPNYDWNGIYFQNESLDNLSKIENVVIRHAYYGIEANNASPVIKKTHFSNSYWGVHAKGSSNPVVNYCDFTNMGYYAVDNENKSFVINAENNWWGSNTGPTHSGNPGGKGFATTDAVDYDPWLTTGSHNPLMGDVSLNGKVQSFDASLVLQKVVASLVLNAKQELVADVTANGSISAMDASLILQYTSGIINKFPAEEYLRVANPAEAFAGLQVGSGAAQPGDEVLIPLYISGAEAMIGSEVQLKFDPAILSVVAIESGDWTQLTELHNTDQQQGILRLALSGVEEINTDGILVYVRFKVAGQLTGNIQTPVTVTRFMANESDQTALSSDGFIEINGTTGTVQNNLEQGLKYIHPNPFRDEVTIPFVVTENTKVVIEVYTIMGKKVNTLTEEMYMPGAYNLKWNGADQSGETLSSGYYFISMKAGDQVQVRKVVLSR